jgi:hypothetical protein
MPSARPLPRACRSRMALCAFCACAGMAPPDRCRSPTPPVHAMAARQPSGQGLHAQPKTVAPGAAATGAACRQKQPGDRRTCQRDSYNSC